MIHPRLQCSAHTLTHAQRDAALAALHTDGYAVLPLVLPPEDLALLNAAVDACAERVRAARPAGSLARSVKLANIVDEDPLFLELALYPPAMQLSHDAFGCGAFHLNQSNLVARPQELALDGGGAFDFVSASPWHADGPRPAALGSPFPSPSNAGGAVGLHYLKFGYFFTDLTHGTGGSLEVVRGSHVRSELDGKGGADTGKALPAGAKAGAPGQFDPREYDVVRFDVPAGTVVAFHQALWHAAMPNTSPIERRNAYISYCPTWMRPVDRAFPSAAELDAREGLSKEARWLLGEPRPPMRWWIPSAEDLTVLDRYARVPGGAAFAGYDAARMQMMV